MVKKKKEVISKRAAIGCEISVCHAVLTHFVFLALWLGNKIDIGRVLETVTKLKIPNSGIRKIKKTEIDLYNIKIAINSINDIP